MAERAWRPPGPLKHTHLPKRDKFTTRSVERDKQQYREEVAPTENYNGYNSLESLVEEEGQTYPRYRVHIDESTVAKITNMVVKTIREHPELLDESDYQKEEFVPSRSQALPKLQREPANLIRSNPMGTSKIKYTLRDPQRSGRRSSNPRRSSETDKPPRKESFTSEGKEQLKELYSDQLEDLKKKYFKKRSGNLSTIDVSQVDEKLPDVGARREQPLHESPVVRERSNAKSRAISTNRQEDLPSINTIRKEKSVEHRGLAPQELPTFLVVGQHKKDNQTQPRVKGSQAQHAPPTDRRYPDYQILNRDDHKIHRYLPHESAGPGILLLPKPDATIELELPRTMKLDYINLKQANVSEPCFRGTARLKKGKLFPSKHTPRERDNLTLCRDPPDKAVPDGYDDPLPILSMLQGIFARACHNEAERYVRNHGEERDDAREFLDEVFDWALQGDWGKYKEDQQRRKDEGVYFDTGDQERKYSYFVSVFPNPIKASLYKNSLVMQPLPALSLRPKLLESSTQPLSLQKTKAISLVPSRTLIDTAQQFHRNPSLITRQRNDKSDNEDLYRELSEAKEPNIDRYIEKHSRSMPKTDIQDPKIAISHSYNPDSHKKLRYQEQLGTRNDSNQDPYSHRYRQTGEFALIEDQNETQEMDSKDPLESPKRVAKSKTSAKPATQVPSTTAASQTNAPTYQVPVRITTRPTGPVVNLSNVMTPAEQQRLLGRSNQPAQATRPQETSGMSIGYNPSIGKVARGNQDLEEIRQLRAEIRELRRIQAQQPTNEGVKSRSVSKSPSLLFVTERDREVAEFYQLEPPNGVVRTQDDQEQISFPYHNPAPSNKNQQRDYKVMKTPDHIFNAMYGQRTLFFGEDKTAALQTASDGFKGNKDQDKGSYVSSPDRPNARLKSAKPNNNEVVLRAQTNVELSLEAKIFENGGPARAIAGQLHLAEKFFYENVKNEARMIDHNEPDKTIPANEARDGTPLDTMLELSRASFVCRDGVLIYLQFSYKPRKGFDDTPHLHGRKYFCRGFEREIDEAKRIATSMPDEIEISSNAGGFPSVKNVHIEDYIYTVGKVVLLNYVFDTVEVHYRARSNLLTKIIFQSVQGQRIVIGEPEQEEYHHPLSVPTEKISSPRGQDTLVSRTTFLAPEKISFVSAGFDRKFPFSFSQRHDQGRQAELHAGTEETRPGVRAGCRLLGLVTEEHQSLLYNNNST